MKGTFLKKVTIPLFMLAPHIVLPFAIKNNKKYQLRFNDELNHWELIVSEIEKEV